jgi:osmotically-inducible protein OsmY
MKLSRHLNIAILMPAVVVAVASPLQASATDDRIEAAVENSYNFKKHLANDGISVKSVDGVVTLSGNVSQDYHKTLAEATAADIPGVQSVRNDIRVTAEPMAERSDGWISLKVKAALAFHRQVSAAAMEVDTRDGVVTLRGPAENAAQKELTASYARDVDGVREVRNEMTILPHPGQGNVAEKVDDASITAQIKTALLLNRSTHSLATKIKTRDGVVTLQGEAKNQAEKELAGKLAEDTEGVRQVENRMTVKPS